MLKRKWRSAIINLSSIFGEINCPYHSVYSGTKRFLDVFSRSLAMEVSSKVDVMSLKPLMVTTPMTRNSKSFGAISPE
jgi:17beta-estradiol 17-dehydrogenase / very-long-chain 3-oxoacyl-CoA reductase